MSGSGEPSGQAPKVASAASESEWIDPVMAEDSDAGDRSAVDSLLRAGQSGDGSSTLFVMSAGFDPRCTFGLRRFIEATGSRPSVLAVDPQPRSTRADEDLIARRASNVVDISNLCGRPPEAVEYPSVHDDASAGRLLAHEIASSRRLQLFETVVFDLSAFPLSLALAPMLALLEQCGRSGRPRELQVLVTENPELDSAIRDVSLGSAHLVPGFGRNARRESIPGPVRVWAPVLGVGAGPAMKKVADLLDPQEVCPIAPFPARNPRLADRLFLEHRQLLVDEYDVQPTSIIHASETNPFDLYRKLVRFDLDYQSTLKLIGGARVALSAHGSKLLSIGALLAAFERKLPFYAVRATAHSLPENHWDPEQREQDRLVCLWLRGSPYLV